MTKLITTTALAFLLFGFFGCDQLEDLAEQELTFHLDDTFEANNVDGKFSNSTTINALDDGNIRANLDNIKGYEIEKVTIAISNLETDTSPNFDDLKLSIGGSEHSIKGISSLADMEIQGEMEVRINAADLEAIRTLIAAGSDISITASATIDDGPASFDLTLGISGTVTLGL